MEHGGIMTSGKNYTKKPNASKSDIAKEIGQIERDIIDESIKITKNEVSSCYTLVMKTKRLLELRLMQS